MYQHFGGCTARVCGDVARFSGYVTKFGDQVATSGGQQARAGEYEATFGGDIARLIDMWQDFVIRLNIWWICSNIRWRRS
jgi:hypothetical protein